MDVQMPGISGFYATRQILRIPGLTQLSVLGLTAGFVGQSDAQYREASMRGVVTKPFSITELSSRIPKVATCKQRQVF
jgi:CheY-like chemotaxis protein